jgi:hypothetical protein
LVAVRVEIAMDVMTLQVVIATVMVAIAAVVLGVFWISGIRRLRRDWRGKALGEIPFCTKCDYNLTGVSSEICPECGLPLTAGNVRRGEAKPKWTAVADTVFFLLVLLVVSLLFLTVVLPSL